MIRYQITDGTAHLNEGHWIASLRSEVDFIQIRESELSTRGLAALLRRAIHGLGGQSGPKILVNDRADVAIACGAAGVHLRSRAISPERIRIIAPAGIIITVACHGEEDVERAAGADYALVAPVFRPLSKDDSRMPLGLKRLSVIAKNSPVPVIALGGITEENAASCLAAGAAGVAGITLFRRG